VPDRVKAFLARWILRALDTAIRSGPGPEGPLLADELDVYLGNEP
jgi:hypothetical protein